MAQPDDLRGLVAALRRMATAIEMDGGTVDRISAADQGTTIEVSFAVDAPGQPPVPRGGTTLEEQVMTAFNAVIHPLPTAGAGLLKVAGVLLALGLFRTVLAASAPFIPEWWTCEAAAWLARQGIAKSETSTHACEWVALVAQIAIILFIGGAAFTESFARTMAGLAARLQQATVQSQLKQSMRDRETMEQAYRKLTHIGQTRGRYHQVKAALDAINMIVVDATQLPNRFIWFGVRGMVVNFPGGGYGFLGFVCLFIQVLAISIKMVLDYLPAACH